MGQSNAIHRDSQDSKEEYAELEQQSSFCCCQLLFKPKQTISEKIQQAQYWVELNLEQLRTKYKKLSWNRHLRQLISETLTIDQIQIAQEQLTQEILELMNGSLQQQQNTNHFFSIQFRNKSDTLNAHKNVINQSKLEKQTSNNEWNLFKNLNNEFIIEEQFCNQLPQRANSLIEESNNKKKASQSKLYKSVMSVIEDHLRDPQNPLNICFQTYLIYYRDQIIEKSQSWEDTKFEMILPFNNTFRNLEERKYRRQSRMSYKIVDDIKGFADFMLYAIFTFYNIDKIIDTNHLNCFTVENLSSFVITLLFRNDELFHHLFKVLSDLYAEETDKYYNNILEFYEERPNFFGVPSHLELLEDQIEQLYTVEDYDQDDSHNISLNKQSVQIRQFSLTPNTPYQLAIQQLQQLNLVRSPVHQLKLISKTTDYIQQSINQFYVQNNLKLIKNFGADELIPILVYVVVKSKIRELGTYLKVVYLKLILFSRQLKTSLQEMLQILQQDINQQHYKTVFLQFNNFQFNKKELLKSNSVEV